MKKFKYKLGLILGGKKFQFYNGISSQSKFENSSGKFLRLQCSVPNQLAARKGGKKFSVSSVPRVCKVRS